MFKSISSLQNPLIKQVVALIEKSRERRKANLFIIEGVREIELAIKGNYNIKTILYCASIFSEPLENLTTDSTEIIEISSEIYQKLAYRSTTEGILAIAETRDTSISKVKIETTNPLILIAEAPEKPGNIGAILRTADAANVDLVCIANPKTDIYNPNIIRSSVGCVFTNTIATGTTNELISFLKSHNISIYSATLQAAVHYNICDFTKPTAIVVGTEATGLSQEWRDQSFKKIIIPMQGEIDSMNVSVAAGILIFEAKRQRGFSI